LKESKKDYKQALNNVKDAFTHIRENWDYLANDLISKGLMKPERKIRAYLFRMFDKNTVYQSWKDELALINSTSGDQKRAKMLQAAIDNF